MAKAKKKAVKKPVRKAATKKTIAKRKPAAKARKGGAARSGRKPARRPIPSGVQLGVSLELDTRLRNLATQMDKSLEDLLIQALTEFADNWEDHLRTMRTLNAGDDRMQLAVPDEDPAS